MPPCSEAPGQSARFLQLRGSAGLPTGHMAKCGLLWRCCGPGGLGCWESRLLLEEQGQTFPTLGLPRGAAAAGAPLSHQMSLTEHCPVSDKITDFHGGFGRGSA